mgnify:FL=1
MTDQLFFDTDCMSSFLWVKKENILLQLYPGRIVLPQEVFEELSNPSIPHIRKKISSLCTNKDVIIKQIMANTEEFTIYYELAISPPKGEIIIGRGEAAALALARAYNGIIASNNLKDISKYVDKYRLNHVTTGDILVLALNNGLIDESTGNQIWSGMLSKRRLLPSASFSDFLRKCT